MEAPNKFRNLREEFALIVLNVVEARRPHNQTIYPLLREPKTVSREQREGAGEREQEGEMKSKEYNISLHVFLAFLHTDISLFLAISHVNTLKSWFSSKTACHWFSNKPLDTRLLQVKEMI